MAIKRMKQNKFIKNIELWNNQVITSTLIVFSALFILAIVFKGFNKGFIAFGSLFTLFYIIGIFIVFTLIRRLNKKHEVSFWYILGAIGLGYFINPAFY